MRRLLIREGELRRPVWRSRCYLAKSRTRTAIMRLVAAALALAMPSCPPRVCIFNAHRGDATPVVAPSADPGAELPRDLDGIITRSLDRHAQRLQRVLPGQPLPHEIRRLRLNGAAPDDWRRVVDALAPFMREVRVRTMERTLVQRRRNLHLVVEVCTLTTAPTPRHTMPSRLHDSNLVFVPPLWKERGGPIQCAERVPHRRDDWRTALARDRIRGPLSASRWCCTCHSARCARAG